MRRCRLSLIGAAWLAMSSVAVAGSAYTTHGVNVRAGAGVEHRRIATLPRGTALDVGRCIPGWCEIVAPGIAGWIAAPFLSSGNNLTPVPRPQIDMPRVVVPQLVIPRAKIHNYGHRDQHEFQRPYD